jgi:hypothetical protein
MLLITVGKVFELIMQEHKKKNKTHIDGIALYKVESKISIFEKWFVHVSFDPHDSFIFPDKLSVFSFLQNIFTVRK